MLTHLLKSLFGTRRPSDLARSAFPRWEDWLRPIDGASPAGADPAYEDEFQAVRGEVDKVAGVDEQLIVAHTARLLERTAKDARVAAYHVYGRMLRDGAEGVADGFELLAALVDRFGESLLPSRPESRKSAIEWLAGGTFANRLDQVHGLSGPLLERTLSAIAVVAERTAEWPDAGRPDLAPLFRRFESRIEQPAVGGGPTPTAAPAATTAPAGTPIASSHELLDRARQMAAYLREQPAGYLAAWRLMRCIRWDTLEEVPPHEAGGKTRLPAPRPELRSHLKRLLSQKQWSDLLERVEAAFAEGANHFWLDLQYYAFIAQEHAGHEYAAARDIAAMDCVLLLQRLPGLEQLSFSDGSPFAEGTTLEWVARHAMVQTAGHDRGATAGPAPEGEDHWADLEAQALALATAEGPDDALAWLRNRADLGTGHRRFLSQLVMARVAERAGRADIAVHLLTSLDAIAQRHRLAHWEPALAFEVKEHLMRLLKTRLHRKDADKAAIARQVDTLLGDLVALDPARATSLH